MLKLLMCSEDLTKNATAINDRVPLNLEINMLISEMYSKYLLHDSARPTMLFIVRNFVLAICYA